MKRSLNLWLKDGSFYFLCFAWFALTFSIALFEITFTGALILWLIWRWREKSFTFALPRNLQIPLFLFLALCLLSIFWSEAAAQSFRGGLKVLKNVLMLLMVSDVFCQKKKLRRFEAFFLIVAGIHFLDGFAQYLYGRDFLRGYSGEDSYAGVRVSSSFKTYGLFAAFLVSIIPFLSVLAYRAWKTPRGPIRWRLIVSVFAIPGLLALLFLTRSRGAWLAFAAGLFLFFLFRRHFKTCLLLTVLAGGIFLALPRNMIFHFDVQFQEQSLVERYHLWLRAVDVIKAKPLTGTGINTYAVAHQKYDTHQNWRVRDYYAHNGYLQMAAETGLPSLFCFLWFLWNYFRLSLNGAGKMIFQEKLLPLSLLMGILNFLLFVISDTILHNTTAVLNLWFLMGLQWAYQRAFGAPVLAADRT